MSTLFKSNNPLSIIFLFFYGILLRFAVFLAPTKPVVFPLDGVLYKYAIKVMAQWGISNSLIFSFLAYLFIFIQALLLNKYINQYRMFSRVNFLPAYSYVLISAIFPEWWLMSAALVSNTLLIWIWGSMISIYKKEQVKNTLFYAGILLGVCSFLFVPALFFGLMLLIWLMILRSFSISEWLISLLGISLPYYFFFAYLFLTDQQPFLLEFMKFQFVFSTIRLDIYRWVGIILIIIPFFISLVYIQTAISRMLIQVRKNWNLLIVFVFYSLIVAGLSGRFNVFYWIIAVVPLAAFHANTLFSSKRKWLPNLVHVITFGYIIFTNIKAFIR